MASLDPWQGADVDPRRPEHADLRASDADRDRVHAVLTEAYADGRLTREELDERTTAVARSRTLGELPPLVADLLPATPVHRAAAPPDLRAEAEAKYLRQRREAVWGMLSASLICLAIWGFSGMGFFWPIFVLLGTGLNVGRLLVQRQDVVDEEVRKLEKRQAKALRRREERDGTDRPDGPDAG